MLFQQLFFLSSDQFLLPIGILSHLLKLKLFSLFCFLISLKFLLPQPLHFPLVLLLFEPSFLLDHLLNFILFSKSLEHVCSELSLHPLLLFKLPSFSLFSFLLSQLHLILLPQSFFLFLLLLPSHLGFVLLLIKLSSQLFILFSFSSSPLILYFQFLEDQVFRFLFLLFCFLYNLSSVIQLFHISDVFLIFYFFQFFFFSPSLGLYFQLNLHILKSILFLSFSHGELFHFTINQGLHNFFYLILFSQVLLISLSFFFFLFFHLPLQYLSPLQSFLSFVGFLLSKSSFLFLHLLNSFCLKSSFANKLIDLSNLLINQLLGPFFVEVGLLYLLLELLNLVVLGNDFIGLHCPTMLLLLSFLKFASKLVFRQLEINSMTLLSMFSFVK